MKSKKQSFLKFKHILRFYQTVKYLKWQQIYYRFYYPIKRFFFNPKQINSNHIQSAFSQKPISIPAFPNYKNCVQEQRLCFTFLNRSKCFHQKIDWKFDEYGRLWTFNLHYFDWLNDDEISKDFCLDVMLQWIDNNDNSYYFFHSYPASLRIRNWIKFLLKHELKNERILSSLYQQTCRLSAFPENEIMGNHLLENGFTLLLAGSYFNEINVLKLGMQIVSAQLKEQVLKDGAHFEKSISYHCLILKNILEILFLCQKIFFTYKFDEKLYKSLQINASKMLSHLFVLTNKGSYVAHFGDSNQEMLIDFNELKLMAQNLSIDIVDIPLSDSGFRILATQHMHTIINLGNITANYQPGHSHADVFSFCLFINDMPVIVDRAVSSYEDNEIRGIERGSDGHNTLCIEGENIHDVWSAFRVGRRAKVSILEESKNHIIGTHDGYYNKLGVTHKRSIKIKNDFLEMNDELFASKRWKSYFYLHFHPDIKMVKTEAGWMNKELNFIISSDCLESYLETYKYSIGMNNTVPAQRIIYKVKGNKISTQLKHLNEKID